MNDVLTKNREESLEKTKAETGMIHQQTKIYQMSGAT